MRQEVLGVFNQSFKQIFANARAIKIAVTEDAEVMKQPVESGAVTTDHRIINLITIEMSIIVESGNVKNVYAEIKQNYLAGTLLTVQTRTNSYANQFITGLPHDEDASMYDAISMGLKLSEFRQVKTQSRVITNPRNPSDSSTVNRGTQLPAAPKISILGLIPVGTTPPSLMFKRSHKPQMIRRSIKRCR